MTWIDDETTCLVCGERLECQTCPTCEAEAEREEMAALLADPEFLAGLADAQVLFLERAQGHGLEVDLDYAARHMYGKPCPAVVVGDLRDFPYREYPFDNLGHGWVIYCPG